MARFNYLQVLLFIAVCAVFIAIVFKIRVPKFWKNFFITDLCIMVIYLIWDYWAITKRNWYFDEGQIIGIRILGKIPIEEILFFLIVPLTSLLTFLALKKLTKWDTGQK